MITGERQRKRVWAISVFQSTSLKDIAVFGRMNGYLHLEENRYSATPASKKRLLRLLLSRYPETFFAAEFRRDL